MAPTDPRPWKHRDFGHEVIVAFDPGPPATYNAKCLKGDFRSPDRFLNPKEAENDPVMLKHIADMAKVVDDGGDGG